MGRSIVVVLVTLTACGCVINRGSPPKLNAGVDYASRYIHRGMVMNAEGVVQGSVASTLDTIDGGSVTFSTWGNLDLDNSTGRAWFPNGHGGKFSEVDLDVQYARQILGPLKAKAGVINYILPNGDTFPFGVRGNTTAMFAEGDVELGDDVKFTPFLRFFLDADEADGFRMEFGADGSTNLAGQVDVRLTAQAGYSDANQAEWDYALHKAGLTDFQGSVEVSHNIDLLATTAFASFGYSSILNGELRAWVDSLGIDNDNFWAQVGFRWTF